MISGGMKIMLNKIIYFVVILLIFLVPGNCLCEKNEIVINADMQYNYAQKCFKNKDYTTAIFEYKRFINFFSAHENVANAEFKIGEAFYNLKEYKKAIMAFNKIILSENPEILISPDSDLAESNIVDAYFMKSKALMLLEKFAASEVCMHNLLQITKDKNTRDRAYSFLTLLYLKIAETNPDALLKAKKYLQQVSLKSVDKSQKVQLTKTLADMNNLETKSPAIAGIASIIPGAGYIYCERYKDGLVSFLFNTALMIAACKAFDDGNPALGGAISFVEAGFYAGNIYGSTASAHKYNRRIRNQYIKNVHNQFHLKIKNTNKDEQIQLFFEMPF
jgi:tetratricopeptide (TPR) repeat protein